MTNTAERLHADIRRLAPNIATRAAEIESGRNIPLDLVKSLQAIGVFRMFVPRSHGGLELDLPAAFAIIEELNRIDDTVGWAAMIESCAALVATYLPRPIYDEIYKDGPDVFFAGSGAMATGTAEAVPGGWRVSGRWAFASGCRHADWMFGVCVMTEGGKPIPNPVGDGTRRGGCRRPARRGSSTPLS